MYAACVKMIRFREENYFKELSEQLTTTGFESEDTIKLALERKRAAKQRNKLFQPFYYVPVFWFLYLFLRSTVVLIEMTETFPGTNERLWRLLPLIYQIVSISNIVYLCDRCSRFIRKKSNQFVMDVMAGGEPLADRLDPLCLEIEETADQEFTVFETFAINRPFILAFLGSLISFTVLFLDVIYDYVFEGELMSGTTTPKPICRR